MRLAHRDKTLMYYALYEGRKEQVDDEGNYTGDFRYTYGKPVSFYAHISPNEGEASNQPFGASVLYSNTILSEDMTLPVQEGTRIWIYTTPPDEETDGLTADYVVKRRAPSKNCILYAVDRLNKDG